MGCKIRAPLSQNPLYTTGSEQSFEDLKAVLSNTEKKYVNNIKIINLISLMEKV